MLLFCAVLEGEIAIKLVWPDRVTTLVVEDVASAEQWMDALRRAKALMHEEDIHQVRTCDERLRYWPRFLCNKFVSCLSC